MRIRGPVSRSSMNDSAMQSRMPQGGKSENVTWHGSKLHDPEFPSSINNDEGSNYFEKRDLMTKGAPKQARI